MMTTRRAELRRRILYHWGFGRIRDSAGRELKIDGELQAGAARMRVFAERLDELDAGQLAQVEERVTPEICAGEACACAGVHIGLDPGSGVQAEVRRNEDGSVTILDVSMGSEAEASLPGWPS